MFYWDISSMNFRENKNENKKNMFSFSKETQSIGCNYKNRFYEKKKKNFVGDIQLMLNVTCKQSKSIAEGQMFE